MSEGPSTTRIVRLLLSVMQEAFGKNNQAFVAFLFQNAVFSPKRIARKLCQNEIQEKGYLFLRKSCLANKIRASVQVPGVMKAVVKAVLLFLRT